MNYRSDEIFDRRFDKSTFLTIKGIRGEKRFRDVDYSWPIEFESQTAKFPLKILPLNLDGEGFLRNNPAPDLEILESYDIIY